MLQQILKEMYIDPDVLNALNEEQKKTLFLKMRQEQVRRWKEREEKMEREEPRKPKLRPAHSKSVSWLLGCDGDVQVIVIGEVDEFKSSKILRSGLGERKAASLHNHSHNQEASLKSNLVNRTSTEPVRSGRENLPPKTLSGVQLNLKENSEVRMLPPPQVSACEQKPTSPIESVKESEEEDDTDDPVVDTLSLSSICYRPHLMPASILHSLPPQDTQQKTSPLSITSRLSSSEASEPHISRGKDFRVMSASKRTETGVGGENRVGRGRVAELMKTFSVSSDSTCSQPPPRSNKPPVPNKPTHLQHLPSNSFR
ncbi:SH2 domain-containing protein 4A [Neoarius graeffei]|uniref:SH2 domain-containing protein 4A n=1 Tax=Neoarius graeffei TaxID=443677 RepID=UPI00298C08B4|nr:SH2 domain-containing protein 4A [Neoarius graeffei]XP_060792263.1 SH2 domain-containing protein 4A [Neoarius graeffei]